MELLKTVRIKIVQDLAVTRKYIPRYTRLYVYPSDGTELAIEAAKRGTGVTPADIIKELLALFKGKLKTAAQLK